MIKNFENITNELTEYELTLIPSIIKGFNRYSKEYPIKAPDIVSRYNASHSDYKLTEPRLRKMVNYIRSNGLAPLIATSKGYYVSNDVAEIKGQIESLRQRADSISSCAKGLEGFLKIYT